MSYGSHALLRPPLKMEIEESSGSTMTPDEQKVVTVVADDEGFLDRLLCECCSQCRPHPSYFDDTDNGIPQEWHHMPWDEIEMKAHELVDSRCHHVQAATPLDEFRIRRQKVGSVERGIETEVNEYSSEKSGEVETSWSALEFANGPSLRMTDAEESGDENVTVKYLLDGGRFIVVRGEKGCRVRMIENERGERVLVSTRCCGHGVKRSEDSGVQASMETTASTVAGKSASTAPPFALMSGKQVARATHHPASPPPTLSAAGRPLPFESVVEDSAASSAAVRSNLAKATASAKSKEILLKSVRKSTSSASGQRIVLQVTMRVKVDPKLKEVRPKK